MSGLTPSKAELIGTALQSLLFGLYIALFIGCLFVLFRKRGLRSQRGQVNKVLVTITIALFLLITSHWCICVTRNYRAFTHYASLPGGSDAYFEYTGSHTFIGKTSLYVAQTFIADITMVYRLYFVWGQSWRIIVAPVITSTALLVSGTMVVHFFAMGIDVFTGTDSNWIVIIFVTSMSTNLVVASLITYRIWSINRRVQGLVSRSLMHVAVIVIESATLYTIFLTIMHASYFAKSNFSFVAVDVMSPIIGIASSFIIIRADLGLGVTPQSKSTRAGNSTFVLSSIEFNVSSQVDRLVPNLLDDGLSGKHSPREVPSVESQ